MYINHSHLKPSFSKPLWRALKRLQAPTLSTRRDDWSVEYRPGTSVSLVGCLSRTSPDCQRDEPTLRVRATFINMAYQYGTIRWNLRYHWARRDTQGTADGHHERTARQQDWSTDVRRYLLQLPRQSCLCRTEYFYAVSVSWFFSRCKYEATISFRPYWDQA